MPNIIDLITLEEGWRAKPYIDTEGYPTVGYGFKIGPKLAGGPAAQKASLEHYYQFILPQSAGDAWLMYLIRETLSAMESNSRIAGALKTILNASQLQATEDPRACVLISMSYQMGVAGLADFRNTLLCITNGEWWQAETQMLKSRWANQTPKRARRHAWQMRHGKWHAEYVGG